MTNAARLSIAIAIASTASGCLAKSLAVDTQAILVLWQIDDRTPLGCVAGSEELPLLKIRSHIQSSPDPDDEYFDWVPCLVEDVAPEEAFRGQTTPLELGPYDVEVELWTWDRARVLARASQPHTALLDNTPPGPLPVEVTLVPVRPDPPAE